MSKTDRDFIKYYTLSAGLIQHPPTESGESAMKARLPTADSVYNKAYQITSLLNAMKCNPHKYGRMGLEFLQELTKQTVKVMS